MQLPADSDKRALWALGIASVLVQIPFLERGYSPLDEGSMLAIAQALGDGEVLYRDKATFISPFMYELMSALLSLFGETLTVGRVFAAGVFSGTVMAVYSIARSFVSVRWAAVTALSLSVLKPLALPLWTIPNYNQLSMLFALLAVVAMLRFLRAHHAGALVWVGAWVGLTVITKLSLGAAIGLAVALTAGLEAWRSATSLPRELLRRALVLGGAALVPVAVVVLFYASQGALETMLDRTLLALVGVSNEMRVPMPNPGVWTARGEDLFNLQYEYFPSPIFNWSLLREIDLYGSWAGRVIEQVVKLLYYGPLVATLLAFWAGVREWRLEAGSQAACGWMLLASFSALAYGSTVHRLDFAHILNMAPAPLLVCAIVMQRWPVRVVRLPLVVLAVWLAAGAFATYAVYDIYDTRLETPRGDLLVTADDAADATELLAFLGRQPRESRILLLRTMPMFYFLSDRPIPGRFDLYLPGYFRPGEDARTARMIETLDAVVYNPNDSIGIPKPITQFAPLTARALADRFQIEAALNPTAFVLKPRRPAPREKLVADITREFDAHGSAPDRVVATSWLMYPVVTTTVRAGDRAICFTHRQQVQLGDTLSVLPMFHHLAWTDRYWHEAARRAHLAIEVRVEDGAKPQPKTLYAANHVAGPPGDRIEIGLDRYVGRRIALRFCAQRFLADHEKRKVATVGWADARIVRFD